MAHTGTVAAFGSFSHVVEANIDYAINLITLLTTDK